MAIGIEYIESDLQLAIHIICKNISSIQEINVTFDGLDEALKEIEKDIVEPKERATFTYLIKIVATGGPSERGLLDPHKEGEYSLGSYNPWESFCPEFWTKAIAV